MTTHSHQALSVQSQPSYVLRLWNAFWSKPATPAIAPRADEASTSPIPFEGDRLSLPQTYSLERRTFM